MDEGSRPIRIVRLTQAAVHDIAGVDSVTAATWGELQAEKYLSFLSSVFAQIAENPRLGSEVDEFPGIYVFTAKIVRRRDAHGHRIFYREIEGGIRVIRVLHTAMNWPDHLDDRNQN